MTVNSLTSSAEFATDGVNRLFPFYFKFLDKKDLVVGFVNSAGVGTTLALNVDYTVTGEGDEAGGKITTTVAPAALGRLVVTRKMEATQKTALRNQGRFFAEVHETVFDRLTMLLQQAMAMASRALRTSVFEAGGIDPLPLVARRANKLLAFDVDGQPVASNLSLETLEQQPAMAAEAAAAAKASADAAGAAASSASGSASSANASKIAAAGAANAAAGSAQAAADAGLQLGMSAWGFRAQPFKGFAPDDGQELDRSVYPGFAAALDSGLIPTTTEADWQANPYRRGFFVANSSPGKFRMRDLNGAAAGSIGGVFQRGTWQAGQQILRDQMQTHKHRTTQASVPATESYPWAVVDGFTTGETPTDALAAQSNVASTQRALSGAPYTKTSQFGEAARIGAETYPTHVTGCWMTRLYGLITPLGSAEASSLATAYASMASRISVLEGNQVVTRRWTSSPMVLPATSEMDIQHNMGRKAITFTWEWTLNTSVGGYSAGTVFVIENTTENNYSRGIQVFNNSANSFRIKVNSAGNAGVILNTAGANVMLNSSQASATVTVTG